MAKKRSDNGDARQRAVLLRGHAGKTARRTNEHEIRNRFVLTLVQPQYVRRGERRRGGERDERRVTENVCEVHTYRDDGCVAACASYGTGQRNAPDGTVGGPAGDAPGPTGRTKPVPATR